MEKNIIRLSFPKNFDSLIGSDYGEKIFLEQVQQLVDYQKLNVLVFPNTIEDIGTSFVQGFMIHILEHIEKHKFYDFFQIDGSDEAKKQFSEGLYY